MKKLVFTLMTALFFGSTLGLAEEADVMPTTPDNAATGTVPSPGDTAKPEAHPKAEREPARKKHKKRKHRRHHRKHH